MFNLHLAANFIEFRAINGVWCTTTIYSLVLISLIAFDDHSKH
jgi:hypothetical protein